jgi:hypothetical protein
MGEMNMARHEMNGRTARRVTAVRMMIGTLGMGLALLASGLPAGCSDNSESASCPDEGTGDTSAALTVADCVNTIGWQYDFAADAGFNGITNSDGIVCTGAKTVEWFQEDPAAGTYTQVMAWDNAGMCLPRTPTPDIDDPLCTFQGTHTWEMIPGMDPNVRMALVEHVNTITGDYDGDGTDDKCGPASPLEGTTTRYVVEMSGACGSGTKLEIWEPQISDDEAFPGDMYATVGGVATPAVICHQPGSLDQGDHLPGRLLCPIGQSVSDADD